MRNLTIIFACAASVATAQPDSLSKSAKFHKPLSTSFYGGLNSTYCFNGGIMSGLHLGGRASITRRWSLQAGSSFCPIQIADRPRAHNQEVFHTKTPGLYTAFNYSHADVLFLMRSSEMRLKGLTSTERQMNRATFLKAGFTYYQQSLYSNMSSPDYFQIDTTSYGGGIYVKGTRSQIVNAGLQQVTTHLHSKYTLRTTLYAEALLGTKRSLPTLVEQEDGSFKNYGREYSYFKYEYRWGWRAGIICEYFRKGHWGAYMKLEAAKVPSAHFNSVSRYYVPRGGEGVHPYLVSVQLGAVYRLQLQ